MAFLIDDILNDSGAEGRRGLKTRLPREEIRNWYPMAKSQSKFNLTIIWVTRNYTKRLKDGEEQRDSPTYIDVSGAQGQHLLSGYSNSQGIYSSVITKVMILCTGLGHVGRDIKDLPFMFKLIKNQFH
nr:hypothetical protein CFP56_28216 [Quercus suber]